MTSSGSAYNRFQRAVRTRNMALIRAAAKELAHIELTDALLICLVMHEREPDRYDRAAALWVARFVTERPDSALLDLELAAACLRSPGRSAAEQLAFLCDRHGLRDTAVAVRQAIPNDRPGVR